MTKTIKILLKCSGIAFLFVLYSIWDVDNVLWNHFWKRMFGMKNLLLPVFDNLHTVSTICKTQKIVLYGVFSTVQSFKKRMILRSKIKCNLNNANHSTIFVIGRPESMSDYQQLMSESLIYHDIFVLSCRENMNDGKSFQFFRQAVSELPCFRFYAKVDDDTAFKATEITNFLSQVSINNVYLGKQILNEDGFGFNNLRKTLYFKRNMNWLKAFKYYHAGLLYILDKDVIKKWVELRPTFYGDEDMRTAFFMNNLNATLIDFGANFHAVILKTFIGTLERFFFYIKLYFNQALGLATEGETMIWQLPILNTSLAVHLCKDPEVLSDSLNQICQ